MIFELTLLADESLVQAGWQEPPTAALLAPAVKLLSQGPTGRAPLPLPGAPELQWSAAPGRAITSVRLEGRVVLVGVALHGTDASEESALLELWLAALRDTPAIQKLHGTETQAFEVFRVMKDRPLCAAVLFPEGTLEEQKALVDLHRAIAWALVTARWP